MGEQPGERRSHDRLALTAECELMTDESQLRVQLADVSPSGCRFEADGTVPAGTAILLLLHAEFPPVEAEVVWTSGGSHGAQFSEALDPELIQALLAMSRLYGERFATNVHRED